MKKEKTEERKNRFNGESVMLTKEEARIHDKIFIEYIYIFKNDQWHVSTQKMYKTKDGYDHGNFSYYTKFEPVIKNKEYIKYKDKHEKHAEVKMVSQIGNLLSKAGFDGDNVMVQGGKAKKSN